jgi:hypothetical protein
MDPRKQFSKWLARFGAIIWGIYAIATIPLVAYRPEAAMACVWLLLVMTFNKGIDTVAYTKNSTTEKILMASLDKIQMQLSMKGVAQNVITSAIANSANKKNGGEEDEELSGGLTDGLVKGLKDDVTDVIKDEMADVTATEIDTDDDGEIAEVNG